MNTNDRFGAPPGDERVAAVGAILLDDQGRLLLVRRDHEPSAGLWSVPGGKLQPGESPQTGCAREVREETGLVVLVHEPVGRLDIATDTVVYDVTDFRCTVVGGALRAGDDARDARWFDTAELAILETAPGLLQTLTRWGVVSF